MHVIRFEPGGVIGAELVGAVWGEHPPAAATETLRSLVSGLRRDVPDLAVQRAGDGYRLDVAAENVDALRFEDLIRDGRASAASGAKPVGRLRACKSVICCAADVVTPSGPMDAAPSPVHPSQMATRRADGSWPGLGESQGAAGERQRGAQVRQDVSACGDGPEPVEFLAAHG